MSKQLDKHYTKKFLFSQGFTLIELLVIIIIIGILVSFTFTKIFDGLVRARDAQRKSDLKQLQTALQLYYDNNDTYPYPGTHTCNSNDICWKNLFGAGKTNMYIKAMPTDPLTNTDHLYYYCFIDLNTYVIIANLENSGDKQGSSTYPNAQTCTTNSVSDPHWYWLENPL